MIQKKSDVLKGSYIPFPLLVVVVLLGLFVDISAVKPNHRYICCGALRY